MSVPPAGEAESFEGRRALVLGLGRFDGGLGTVRFLRGEGADVRVSDTAPREALADSATRAEALGARLVFGPQTVALLDGIDVVFANPAIPFDHPVLAAAETRGIPVTTEINVVLARCRAPIYGVTGTKGKSTTATLLAAMLRALGHRVHLGGNIGASVVDALGTIGPAERVVLELSSFQLHWAHRVRRSPQVAVVTNLLSDHLDRHGTQQHYADSKRAILDYQGEDDLAVLPAEDAAVAEAGWFRAGAARKVPWSTDGLLGLRDDLLVDVFERSASLAGMRLLGAHNRRNVLAAATAVLLREPAADGAASEAQLAAVAAAACAVEALPHRMQPVAEVDGVLYVDDSNATQPASTQAALAALERPVVLVLGGKDKGADVAALLDGVRARAKAVVVMGGSAAALAAALEGTLPVAHAADVEAAVVEAARMAAPGDVVLLSPAYASLDQYASFAERGDRFQAAVRALMGPVRPR